MSERKPESRGSENNLGRAVGWSLALFGTAALIRGFILWQLTESMTFNYALSDGRALQLWSRGIAEGTSPLSSALIGPPLYPLFMAGLFKGLGESLILVRSVQVVLGSAACVLLMQAGWVFRSKATGLIAGFLLAIYPVAIWSDFSIHTASIDVFLLCLALALAADFQGHPQRRKLLNLGLVLGLLFLSRESAYALVVASILILFVAAKASWADRGLNALVLLGGVAIVVVPMTWADWSARGDLRLLKAPLSYHLYQGAPNGSGRGGLSQPSIDGNTAAEFVSVHLGHFPTAEEMSEFYDQQIEARASAGQGNSAGGFLRKLLLSLDATEPFDTQEAWLHAEHSKFLNGLLEIVTFGWILPLAFFGAWVVWPERSRLSWLYGWSFFWLSWSVIFYHYGRHRLMLVPILLLFAAAGLVGAFQFFRSRPRWVVVSAIVSTAVILWVSQGTLVRANVERSLAYHGVASGLAELGLEELATLRMEDALDFDSDNAFAHHDLGALYAQRRWYGAAANHFSEAVRVRPDYEQAYRDLAEAQYASFESARAAETYKALLRLQPQNADVWFELGRAQLDADQFDEAQVSFRRSMALKRGSAAPPAQ